MKLPDPPDELILVPILEACLLLTAREYVAGLRRGRWWKRRRAMLAREDKRNNSQQEVHHE